MKCFFILNVTFGTPGFYAIIQNMNTGQECKISSDGIVLLAKQPGPTSFSALNDVKKALGTKKAGHTGTLDSFAQGLLVVCTGRLTRLAGNIMEFDKSSEAVIKFGEETDTLEYTGNIIKTAPLPSVKALENAVKKFTGKIMQRPPAFSAIHVNGKRASDLAREGITAELPAREITVYEAELKEVRTDAEGRVQYAMAHFSVSKGTYIRSLARDIAAECGSAAHLAGLYRTKVGNFKVQDAAGYSDLPEFSIEGAVRTQEKLRLRAAEGDLLTHEQNETKRRGLLHEEIRAKKVFLTEETAALCGFSILRTSSPDTAADFRNGKPLRSRNFDRNLHGLLNETSAAVFTQDGCFLGLIYKDEVGRISYKFVLS